MATHSAAPLWGGLRHPVRSIMQRLSKQTAAISDSSAETTAAPACDRQSAERLEHIAAYARSGYFHVEYTSGTFVVPIEFPLE